MKEMTPKQRWEKAMELRNEGYTYKEIAKRLNVKIWQVKYRLSYKLKHRR